MTAGPAAAERLALADTLAALGPDAPTLLDGWRTADLAAHLVVRERQPLALPGLAGGPFAPLAARITERAKAGTPYDVQVGRFRSGTPLTRLPAVEEAANVVEFFVHHEDARRGSPGPGPRLLDPGLESALWARLRTMAPLLLRRARGVGVRFATPDGRTATGRRGPSTVTVTGTPGELFLWSFGRGSAAQVSLDGEQAAVGRLSGARLGF